MLPRVRLENIRFCTLGRILSDGVPGDLIETGVWRGGGCIFMRGCLKALGHPERVNPGCRIFEGLPEPDVKRNKERDFYHSPVMQKAYQKMAVSEEEVQRNFAAYGLLDENVRLLKGWFKNTLRSAPIEKLALIRLDGDFYELTTDALNGLYDKLAPGGFVIIDDYGEDVWTDCRAAVDELRAAHRILSCWSLSIRSAPTGEGPNLNFPTANSEVGLSIKVGRDQLCRADGYAAAIVKVVTVGRSDG